MDAKKLETRTIRPAARLHGAVGVPGDKSISHRALILGALAQGTTLVRGLAPGLDVRSTRRCLEALGVRIEETTNEAAGVAASLEEELEEDARREEEEARRARQRRRGSDRRHNNVPMRREADEDEAETSPEGDVAWPDPAEERARRDRERAKRGRRAKPLLVHGVGFHGLQEPAGPLDCGNSGTTMRLLSGVLAATRLEVTLTGDASLRRRPMGRVAAPLIRMGAKIERDLDAAGYIERMEGIAAQHAGPGAVRIEGLIAPLRVQGAGPQVQPVDLSLEVASAQVKSAVLLAGLRASGLTRVREPSPSRDHTERMLRLFGVDVLEEGGSVALKGPCDLEATGIDVPGDISSAAFFLCAAAGLPGSRVLVRASGVNPGRTGVLDVLEAMGAKVTQGDPRELGFEPVAELAMAAPERLRAFRVSGDLVPRTIDELVVLAVLAARAEGTSEIRDAKELRVKESDRIALVAENLTRMGARCEALPDGIRVEGGAKLKGARITTGGDHRIAMAFAVAGLMAEGETVIEDPGAADVSFPGFFEALDALCER